MLKAIVLPAGKATVGNEHCGRFGGGEEVVGVVYSSLANECVFFGYLQVESGVHVVKEPFLQGQEENLWCDTVHDIKMSVRWNVEDGS